MTQLYKFVATCGLALFGFSFVSYSQELFSGLVVDAVSRQPIQHATVTDIALPGTRTYTDEQGKFSIRSKGTITVSFIGYKSSEIGLLGLEQQVIALQPDVIRLKDIQLKNNTASRFSSLSRIDLSLRPVKNTQELLRLVPGLFIAQHAGGGKAEQIFLRGFDVDHGTDVQVSMDGMPVNMVSHAHGQGYADAHFIIPETVNNIDFGAGPYYTKQGNFNTAGYVSFNSFKNIPKSMVQVEAGRFNSFRTLAMIDIFKKQKDKQSAYIAADLNYTDGPTSSKQRFRRLNIFGKYNLALTGSTVLTASLSAFASDWDASGQIPGRAVQSGMINRFGSIDPSEGGSTQRHNANIVFSSRLPDGAAWHNQAYYSRYHFDLYSNFTFFLNDPVNGDGIQQKEARDIFGYTSKYNQQYYFGNSRLQSTYGAGLRYDATNNSRLANVVNRKFLNDVKLGDIRESNLFAYIQEELHSGNWLIDAGVRLDHFNFSYSDRLTGTSAAPQQRTIISPKLNVQYTVNSKLQVFVKAGKGFHSNDTRVVVANSGKEILPAAYGTDIGVILKPTENILIHIAAWHLYLQQEFVYVGDAGVIEPSGKSRRQGIDITTRFQFSKNIFANANINFTDPRAIGEPKGADLIPLAPTLTSVGGIYYKAQTGLNGGISYRYIKDRPANEDNSIVAKGYFLADATLNYTRPKFELGLAVENIFNIKWNEAQFATESRLAHETAPVNELHYTPGTPFFARLKFALFF